MQNAQIVFKKSQKLNEKWQELLNKDEGEAIKKVICIDGKTMRSNKREEIKPVTYSISME